MLLHLLALMTVLVTSGEGFTNSNEDLRKVAKIDLDLYQRLKSLQLNFTRIASLERRVSNSPKVKDSFPPSLKRYITNFEDGMVTTWGPYPVNRVVENPIAIYRLLRRLVDVTPELYKIVNYGFDISVDRYKAMLDGRWPSREHVLQAVDDILELHHVYDIDIKKFSEGEIMGINRGITLEAFHCYEIGQRAKDRGYFILAIEWFKQASEKLLDFLDDTVNEGDVETILEETIVQHDEAFDGMDPSYPFLFMDKIQNSSKMTKRRTFQYENFRGRLEFKYESIHTWGLCSLENFQTQKMRSRLKCSIVTRSNPLYTLHPLKLEYLNRDPDILQVYEVPQSHKSDELASYFKDLRGSTVVIFPDILRGGNLAFPKLHLAAQPIPESALIFPRSKNNRENSLLSWSICPVALGQKWLPSKDVMKPVEGRQSLKRYSNAKSVLESEGTQGSSPEHLIHGSVEGLKSLIVEEQNIYNVLKAIVSSSTNLTTTDLPLCVTNFMKDYEIFTEKVQRAATSTKPEDVITSNLLATYLMTWRFRTYLQKLLWTSSCSGSSSSASSCQHIFQYLQRSYGTSPWPDKTYEENSMIGILNLQHIHDLEANDIADGIIKTENTGMSLTAWQCYELGNFAVAKQFYSLGVEWLEVASAKAGEGLDATITPEMAKNALSKALKMHNKAHAELPSSEPLVFMRPAFLNAKGKRVRRKTALYNAFKMDKDPALSEVNYWGLCSGQKHQTESARAKLKCWYESHPNPLWTIGPLKAEAHSLDLVRVVEYHDVVSDSLGSRLQDMASKIMGQSSLKSFYDHEQQVNPKWRLSTHSKLTQVSPETERMSKMAELITGLRDASLPESLQIACYTSGGFYNVHLDSVAYGDGIDPARIATLTYILSSAKRGGELVFPQTGVVIKPNKGSMLYWHNLDASAELNEMTWHGICPIIQGEQSVASKWIHYVHQNNLKC